MRRSIKFGFHVCLSGRVRVMKRVFDLPADPIQSADGGVAERAVVKGPMLPVTLEAERSNQNGAKAIAP